jgi:hypothetical protein
MNSNTRWIRALIIAVVALIVASFTVGGTDASMNVVGPPAATDQVRKTDRGERELPREWVWKKKAHRFDDMYRRR